MPFRKLLESLIDRREIDSDQIRWFLDSALESQLTEVQIASILSAWQVKGATGSEVAILASEVMKRAVRVEVPGRVLVDTCGTGGGPGTFNLSTAGAFVAAAAGASVAKHGNRAVTSQCGSADVLEALGADLNGDPGQIARRIERNGIAFMFAPNHHPALKAVGPIRRQLEVRTIFNQIGPLANPAGAKRQVIGVYAPSLLKPMAEALANLGCESGLVVHGQDGMDEISPCAKTTGYKVHSGNIEPWEFDLSAVVGHKVRIEDIAPGESAVENALMLRKAISDVDSILAQAILPCVAGALMVSGLVQSMDEGIELARATIRSGSASHKLEEFVAFGDDS